MRVTGFVLVLVVGLNALSDAEYELQFSSFKKLFNKTYGGDEAQRFAAFKDNLVRIARHNEEFEAGRSTYTMGVNKFADMTPEEIMSKFAMQAPLTEPTGLAFESDGAPLPASVDWRARGMVTPVRDQGIPLNRGNCPIAGWAFSAAGAVESVTAIRGRNLTALSVQQLIDCDAGDAGCNGGLPDYAFNYVALNSGLSTWEEYPYISNAADCRAKLYKQVSPIANHTLIPQNEQLLMEAVARQPVSAVVEWLSWMLYNGGIFSNPECGQMITAGQSVLVVGYDTAQGYWLVKNSWGTDWGENGYIRLKLGIDMCGIAKRASYPNVAY